MRTQIIHGSLPILASLALGLACTFSPHPKSGVQACNREDRSCPPGYVCAADNKCWSTDDLAAINGTGGTSGQRSSGPQSKNPGGNIASGSGGVPGGVTAVGVSSGGAGGTSNSGASQCAQWAVKLQSCQLIPSGAQFACQEPESDERCIVDCLLNASCSDVRAVACDLDPLSTSLEQCVEACMTATCKNGQSIDPSSVCDGDLDCLDGSDEVDCPVFVCKNGVTIPSSYRCDESEDCRDGSDEMGCPPPLSSIVQCF